MKRNSTLLTPEFQNEIAKSEYQRTRLIIVLFMIALVASSVNYFILDESVVLIFGGAKNYFFVVGWLFVLLVYEIFTLRIIAYHRKKYKRISETFRYVHTLIEVSYPSILMLYMVDMRGQIFFIDSPVIFIYSLFITLSVLHLDFKLSFTTAFLAAAEYAFIVYYAFDHYSVGSDLATVLPENTFYLRCVVLIIGGMAGGFVAEEMKRRIQSMFELQRAKNDIEVLFGQQVSKEVLNTLVLERGLAKKQEATVMALDIRNFTSFAETHTPDEIMDFQNKIFGPVIDIINQHQGVVNQIMGDGIMATFGTPVENTLHPDMAFEAALKIRSKVKELGQVGVIAPTRIGIGLHTGDVITGNIGNENRKQYSISGTSVIVAFRIEQLNKEFNSDMLISDTVKNRIVEGRVQITSLGKQSIKGFDKEVDVYKVS